jgi:hypothetical protein
MQGQGVSLSLMCFASMSCMRQMMQCSSFVCMDIPLVESWVEYPTFLLYLCIRCYTHAKFPGHERSPDVGQGDFVCFIVLCLCYLDLCGFSFLGAFPFPFVVVRNLVHIYCSSFYFQF